MRTFREQLSTLPIDTVSGIVYNVDELHTPQLGRQLYYGSQPHSINDKLNVVLQGILGNLPFTQVVAKGTQTRLRKDIITRSPHTNLRKGILNSIKMRKSCSLKEKQNGNKLNG